MSWGEFWSGTSAIEVWQPKRRLRTIDRRQAGDPYRIVAATGDVFEGEVHTNDAPWTFGGTAAGLNDGLVRFWSEMGTANIGIATWGVDESIVRALETRWQEQVHRALRGTA